MWHEWHFAAVGFPCETVHQHSGTKPNLVAKIWPPNLVTICAWLPNLVANVSSQFYHLVNTGLPVGSLARWPPSMVAHTCKLVTIWVVYVIQIKICAEYRDMLPRPRLVCQEPGLRPIGRSPGVPDKSSRGLGSMSRYSAQILICFIAYIFSIFNFSVGLVGNLAELPPCTVPPATVHCYQNEAAQCSSDNQISQHALLRGSRKKHSLAFMPQKLTELVKLADKMDEICISGKFSVQEPSKWRFLLHTCE